MLPLHLRRLLVPRPRSRLLTRARASARLERRRTTKRTRTMRRCPSPSKPPLHHALPTLCEDVSAASPPRIPEIPRTGLTRHPIRASSAAAANRLPLPRSSSRKRGSWTTMTTASEGLRCDGRKSNLNPKHESGITKKFQAAPKHGYELFAFSTPAV